MKTALLKWSKVLTVFVLTGFAGVLVVTAADPADPAPVRPNRVPGGAGGGPGGAGGGPGQRGFGGQGQRGGGGGGMGGAMMVLDDQQRQLFIEASRVNAEQIRKLDEKLSAAQKELVHAVLAEKYDEAAVSEKAEAVAKIQVEMTMLRAKAFSTVAPTLKAEQRDQLENSRFGSQILIGGGVGGPGGGGGFGGPGGGVAFGGPGGGGGGPGQRGGGPGGNGTGRRAQPAQQAP